MMNPSGHVFEPDLQVQFSGRLCQASRDLPKSSRALFYHLIHNSEYDAVMPFAYKFIQRHLLNSGTEGEAVLLADFIQDLVPQQLGEKAEVFPSQLSVNQAVASLIQSVPSILTSPCWLQLIPQTCSSDANFALQLQNIYMQLAQNPTGTSKLKNQFLAFLMAAGRELPAVHTHAFSRKAEYSDAAFELAAMQLALAQFPRVFFPEILGFTLAYCQLVTVIESIASVCLTPAQENAGIFYLAQQQLLSQQVPKVIGIIRGYLLQFNCQSEVLIKRVQSGHCLYQKLFINCRKQVVPVLPLEQRLQHILRDKAAAAWGHHHRILLGGRPLDAWFEQQPFAGEDFLQALKCSSYINVENPEDSQLLKLFTFNGPMFGVLSDEELQILKSWIADTDNKISFAKRNFTKQPIKQSNTKTGMDHGSEITDFSQSSIEFAKLDNRKLYFYLVNGDLYPEVWHTAKTKVRKLLRSVKYRQHLPFRNYQHETFEEYIKHCYQHEIKAFQPLVDKPRLSRQAYVWGIEQFAPTILTDGCWLQGSTQLQLFPNHALADILYKIYSDEIGNGLLEQNHPHIYRQLLNSLNITLPAIYDPAFIQHKGFISSAFDLPVYLMAISRFPSHFLPELLGLNLAIELSGLGAVYLRLSEELKYWEIDAHIVDLHMTIDNVASGHTALAIKAIKLHLDDINSCFGEREMQQQWQRIYTGYCSLKAASRWFKFALIIQYQLRRYQNIFAAQIAFQ